MMRSYHPENSRTHQNTELKPDWACLVLTWVTRGESQVTHCPFASASFSFTICAFYLWFAWAAQVLNLLL